MLSTIFDYFQNRKERKEARWKEEMVHIICSNPLNRHYWDFHEIYGEAGRYRGPYVVVRREGENYLCSLVQDYSEETRSPTGGRMDTVRTITISTYTLSVTDPLYQKVDDDYFAFKKNENKELKNQLLNKLLELEKEMAETEDAIVQIQEIIEKKRKDIVSYASNHRIPISEMIKVEEEVELERLMTKKEEKMAKKAEWIGEIDALDKELNWHLSRRDS